MLLLYSFLHYISALFHQHIALHICFKSINKVFEILHAINYLVYFDSQDLAITVELTILFAANIGQLLQTPHAHHCLSILYHLNAQRQARKQHVPVPYLKPLVLWLSHVRTVDLLTMVHDDTKSRNCPVMVINFKKRKGKFVDS